MEGEPQPRGRIDKIMEDKIMGQRGSGGGEIQQAFNR
jgi:hypothetical protein